ncbi:DNA polymerase III delta subunit [Salsuginibacillus halophilus]|uniref:DNA polymerase III subunit delta n=1 Tax=Salsuginibacillus halophilus TaxID=517424 RepID=A0A2P8HFS7_9BACI|nr:DNA polymerase III subunit delta [Salsuginibacillus halophilus]PSL45043.1 DNA polymerase III delta subunit [Salsuginibacillus halophilus]
MSYAELKRELKRGEVHPLYLLYGTEDYLIEDVLEEITASVLDEDEKDFNLSRYDMRETPVDAALDEGETLPFFGERRLVIARNASFLTGQKDTEKIEHDLERLKNYTASPPPETVMIITAPYEKLDERKKVVKQLKSHAAVLQAAPLEGGELAKWIDTYVKEKNIAIAAEARQQLAERFANDLMQLASELDKLCLYAGDDGTITSEAVELLAPKTLEDNVFHLVDLIAKEKVKEALQTMYDLLKQNEEPVKLTALIARQFRMMLQAKELGRRGYSEQKIAGVVKVHPYAVKVARKQSQNFSEKGLQAILKELAVLDETLKTGRMEKELALELFVTQIPHLKKEA